MASEGQRPGLFTIYRLKRVECPWGDYGSILQHGMSAHQARKNGCIRLERTGPSIFPITFPLGVVVTQHFRQLLACSDLTGYAFRPVIKHHIVELDWESWDPTADEPEQYPESGEPEDYILERPHSEAASAAMGDLFELVFSENGVDVIHSQNPPSVRLIPESWNGSDFFLARSTLIACVSQKAREWLEQYFGDYVSFAPP